MIYFGTKVYLLCKLYHNLMLNGVNQEYFIFVHKRSASFYLSNFKCKGNDDSMRDEQVADDDYEYFETSEDIYCNNGSSDLDDIQPGYYPLIKKHLSKKGEKEIFNKSKKKKKKKTSKKDSFIEQEYDRYRNFSNDAFEDFGTQLLMKHERRREGIVPEDMVLSSQDSGFFFGVTPMCSRGSYIGKSINKDGHILIVGPPGSNKTTAFAIPALRFWEGIIIAVDVKPYGGFSKQWYSQNKRKGKRVKIFKPMGEGGSAYDPFSFLRADGEKNLVKNARELAIALLPETPEIKDAIWIKTAQTFLTASIIYYFNLGCTFNDTMVAVQSVSVKELVVKILKSEDFIAKMLMNKLEGLRDEVLANIGMDLGTLLVFSSDERILSVFCTEDKSDIIDWRDLNSGINPYDVILEIPEDMLEQWEPVVKLMLNQLIKNLERRREKTYSEEDLPPVLILLDEFPRLGELSAIKSGLATLRSRNVTFALFCQSVSQLEELYGGEVLTTILACCPYKAILGISEPKYQRYFADLLGTMHVMQRSLNVSHDSYGDATGLSRQIGESREYIIQPHELGAINEDYILIMPSGFCKVRKRPFYARHEEALDVPALMHTYSQQ